MTRKFYVYIWNGIFAISFTCLIINLKFFSKFSIFLQILKDAWNDIIFYNLCVRLIENINVLYEFVFFYEESPKNWMRN